MFRPRDHEILLQAGPRFATEFEHHTFTKHDLRNNMFENLQAAPPDAILGLSEAFKADPNPNKVNLGVGIYKNAEGQTPILAAVKKAEAILLEQETTKSYLPINGSPVYAKHVQNLLFGDALAGMQDRVCSLHTPGGTGGLRVAGDFLKHHAPGATMWVSTPTWGNHKGVFGAAGLPIGEYPYYDAATNGVAWDEMVAALRKVPASDVVLLHVCCHNPTGVDLSADQWAQLSEISAEAGWLPFFDFAYQGFGDGIEQDRSALVPFIERGAQFIVGSSFSKNFGLYNERTGACSFVGSTAEQTTAAMSQLKISVRRNYSNPANHGGAIVNTVLDSSELTALWLEELAEMRGRIKANRSALVGGLASRGVTTDLSYITDQRGMFSYSGLSPDQVSFLREKKSVYVIGSGRINMAGLTPGNLEPVCDAIAEAM